MMFSARQAPFTISAAVAMALQPILLTLSKGPQGFFEYSVGSATLACEILKLLFSAVGLCVLLARQPELKGSVLSNRPWREFGQFFVPSLIYFVNNNLVFVILQALDPSTFQLVSQTKTIFTGLLFRFMLKRRLTIFQWMALFFLGCGTACSQIPEGNADHLVTKLIKQAAETGHAGGLEDLRFPAVVGVLITLFTAALSSLAGVYNELLLKGRVTAPLHWQNMQMYIHGVWLNFAFMMVYDGAVIRSSGVFHGYTWVTWAAIICNASVGITVSAVLKYCDNIARVYAHSIAMLVVMLVSVPLFGLDLTAQLIIALLLVTASTLQYNIPQDYDSKFDLIEEEAPNPKTV
jgi:UDP-sugar transporter A1/2/3